MTAITDPLALGAVALATAFQRRVLSTRELIGALERSCRNHRNLNAYISQDFDRLLDANRQGPLQGVPIGIKDNIDTVDLPTSGGTPALKGNRPPRNAPVVERLLAAGALIAGKLNMHELAYGGTNDNLAFGRALNPIDRSRTAGGSSGGSAVAVAAKLAPAALGSDTAGSIRVPAALCGIYGFRPTLGRYPGAGVVPIAPGRDTVGPMARSLDDIILLDGILAGDPRPLPATAAPIRIGIDRARFFKDVSTDIVGVIDRLIDDWRRRGVEFVDVEVSRDLATYQSVTTTIIAYEYIPAFEAYLKSSAPDVSFSDVMAGAASPILRTNLAQRWEDRAAISASDYAAAAGPGLASLRAAYDAVFTSNRLAAILIPATQDVALPFAGDDDVLRGGKAVSSWFYFRNTSHATVLGAPSLAIPAGRDPTGLPVGALLDGRVGCDRDLLATAQFLQLEN